MVWGRAVKNPTGSYFFIILPHLCYGFSVFSLDMCEIHCNFDREVHHFWEYFIIWNGIILEVGKGRKNILIHWNLNALVSELSTQYVFLGKVFRVFIIICGEAAYRAFSWVV